MKLPITRETTGWATSLTRSQRLAALEPVEHADDDRADRVLVVGDPLRREAALEERLEAVVLGRVHADEHRPRELEREDRRAARDAAEFGGVGLPVAADRVDVLGRRHRPEARLVGELLDALGPVHRALPAHLPNSSCGGPSRQCSSSATSTSARSLPVFMPTSCSPSGCPSLDAPRSYWLAGQLCAPGRVASFVVLLDVIAQRRRSQNALLVFADPHVDAPLAYRLS